MRKPMKSPKLTIATIKLTSEHSAKVLESILEEMLWDSEYSYEFFDADFNMVEIDQEPEQDPE